MQSLTQRYEHKIKQGFLKPDAQQAACVAQLQLVADHLQKKRFFWQSRSAGKGLYIWGKVGRGKTFLMDLFFDALPFKDKKRCHFHRFMLNVHQRLKALEGKSNPLCIVAKEVAQKTRVLCFDEFVVEDIADAMILANFFKALFEQGVTLVATSNVAPHHLYWNGLQRELFLPCIQLLEKTVTVFELRHPTDYRRKQLTEKGVYFTPLDQAAEHNLQHEFTLFSKGDIFKTKKLIIDGRAIKTKAYSDNTLWTTFAAMCHIPRSKRDYLLMCEQFEVFLVSDVPQLQAHQEDITRNFISMVDVFYDARKKLILSAATPIEQLYPEGRFAFEFKRTASRLIEMQSLSYLENYNQL